MAADRSKLLVGASVLPPPAPVPTGLLSIQAQTSLPHTARSLQLTSPRCAAARQVMNTYDREWDRRLTTTLGVANSRLYELRLQSANDNFDSASGVVRAVQESFRVREVDV